MARNEAHSSRRSERFNVVTFRFVMAILVMCVLMIMYMMGSFRSSMFYSEGRSYSLGVHTRTPPDPSLGAGMPQDGNAVANSAVIAAELTDTQDNTAPSANNPVFGDFTINFKGINHSDAYPAVQTSEESDVAPVEAEANAALEDTYGEGDLATVKSSLLEDFTMQEYNRMHCLREVRNKLRDEIRPYITHYPGGVALIDVTLHTNLGDNVLWRGAVSILADFGISPKVVCSISQPAWNDRIDNTIPKCDMETVVNVVKNKGLVFLQAGGNWGDLYSFVQVARMKWLTQLSPLAAEHGFKIIQLPVSIYYQSPDSKHLASDIQSLSTVKPEVFVLFVRSHSSYETATKYFNGTDVREVPDLAFAIGPMIPKDKPVYDVLIQSRQDKEKRDEDTNVWDWVKRKFEGTNLTYHVQDWWYKLEDHPREVSKPAMTVLSEVRTFAANHVVSQGKVVITNRLHGSIVSTLVGKHLYYVDTKEGKVGFVRSTAFSGVDMCTPDNLHAHKADSLEAAVDAAINLLQQGGDEFAYN